MTPITRTPESELRRVVLAMRDPQPDEPAYDAWSHQHALRVVENPEVASVRRYDRNAPDASHLTVYEAAAPDEFDGSLISSPTRSDQRSYLPVDSFESSDWDPSRAVLLLAVWMSVPDSSDLDAWYREEHLPMLFQSPGWMRCRRYELVSGAGPRHLALHDLAAPECIDDPAAMRARQTPWRDRIVGTRTEYERRAFRVLGSYFSSGRF